MTSRKRCLAGIALLGACLFLNPGMIVSASAQETQQPAPDNTKTNQDNNGQPTADQQKSDSTDRAITRKIRMAIHKDTSLSTYAHNVKIITQNGKVTLRGPVRSDEEKSDVEAKAVAVAGEGNVDDQLQVAPKQ